MAGSTPANNAFGQLQVGKLVYLDNYYVDPQGDIVDMGWTVPCGEQLGFNCYTDPSPYDSAASDRCELTYNVQQDVGDTTYVRAYPSWLLGTLGGRDSSWGVGEKVGCHQTGVLAEEGRCGNSAVYDMRDVQAATGFPVRPLDLAPTTVCFRNEICAGGKTPVRNTFLDLYLHYIANADMWPDGFLPEWGDLNKINARNTATWNINVWPQIPVLGNFGINWTGGKILTTKALGGINYDVMCKHENPGNRWDAGCGAGFFYIAFMPEIPIPAGELDCTDISALVNWVSSQDFKNTVLASDDCRQIYEDLGSPPFIVDEPNNYLLAGIQGGNEVWFSTEQQSTTECWSDVAIQVGNETFGKVQPAAEKVITTDPSRPWAAGQQVSVGDIIMVASGPNTIIVQE